MTFTFRDAVFFIALLSTAMALGAALAHLFELPNKIGLARDAYFTVQQIYAGWDRLAYLLVIKLVSMLALAPAGVFRRRGCDLRARRRADRILALHLSGQRRDQQLDRRSRGLGGMAAAMGILPRRRRAVSARRHGRADRQRAGAAGGITVIARPIATKQARPGMPC